MAPQSTRQLKSSLFGSQHDDTKPLIKKQDRISSGGYNEQEEDLNESEMATVTSELGKSASTLKHMASDINDEVRVQITSLKGTSSNMTDTQVGMHRVKRHLDQMLDVRTCKQMWTLIAVIVCTFFVCYYTIRIMIWKFSVTKTEA